ncbi:hypothetical protein Halha_1510 [Halobacteroides halobius DSM 5150]|uniref:Phosphosulfolactate synthase n=1 Tax=Halobacteroides halobius (strain ATCC 35273 / DSM 5150 / MD-1) TaxID=748449 RepID=L0K8W1_HALHC|nr:phosphosulfolactate synthase [Halobacteroides halobius]AGB41451.1 hypothetical protein Halha_1510 [Halobacteroides halobius DSM 5150]
MVDYKRGWNFDFEFPLVAREEKPRTQGLTMIIDKGLGIRETKDLLELATSYIDFWKLSFGTSALYPREILKKKIKLIKSYEIDIYPGGTFLEIAINQNKTSEYLNEAKELGFTAVEVSDGTLSLPISLRSNIIKQAKSLGFKVLTEIGKKDKNKEFKVNQMIKQLKKDVIDGADKIIVEARESGTGVSIYDQQGQADQFMLKKILLEAPNHNDIIWETPLKKQQVYFIRLLGNNVNLGNIDPREILALESLRNGLRGDTFKTILNDDVDDGLFIEIDL